MQTSTPHPQVLFIDGLPGSGKSTAAKAVGGALPGSRVFAETDLNHPLLVARPTRSVRLSQAFTRSTRRIRLPQRRWRDWNLSWQAPEMMCCTSLRAIRSRARFGCFFS
jgi:hypothetical protein